MPDRRRRHRRRHGQPPPLDLARGSARVRPPGRGRRHRPARHDQRRAKALLLPTGVLVSDGRLVVADAWHHRILIWDDLSTAHRHRRPTVLGQADLDGCRRGLRPTALLLAVRRRHGGRRLLRGRHREPAGPGLVGRDARTRVSSRTWCLASPISWPRGEPGRHRSAADFDAVAPRAHLASAGHLVVADAGNHRVLAGAAPLEGDRPADVVLGQPDMTSRRSRPTGPRAHARCASPTRWRRPRTAGCSSPTRRTTASDPRRRRTHSARRARGGRRRPCARPTRPRRQRREPLGPRWKRDSLCWPYGLSWHAGRARRGRLGQQPRRDLWRDAVTVVLGAVARQRVRVTGVVQGVGFRPFVAPPGHRARARRLRRQRRRRGRSSRWRGAADAWRRSSSRLVPRGATAGGHRGRSRSASSSPSTSRGRQPPPSASSAPPGPAAHDAGPARRRHLRRVPGRGARPGGPPLPLPVRQLHRLRAALHHHPRPCPTTVRRRRWPASPCARTARPSTRTRATAASTPSRSPARRAARSSAFRGDGPLVGGHRRRC